MPRVVKLPPERLTSGTALLNALFGAQSFAVDKQGNTNVSAQAAGLTSGDSFVRRVEGDQRAAAVRDAIAVTRIYKAPNEWAFVILNDARISNYPGSPAPLARRMNLSSLLVLYAEIEAAIQALDLAKVLRSIKVAVIRYQGPRPASMPGPHPRGLYRRSHEIWVNGRRSNPSLGSLLDDPNAFGQVLNRLDYASTLETKEYSRPYTKALKDAVKRFGGDWDIRMDFYSARAFGGNIRTSRYTAKRKDREYTIPVITVAPANTLRNANRTTPNFIRRRGPKARENPKVSKRSIARARTFRRSR